jgi:hypothetical protein
MLQEEKDIKKKEQDKHKQERVQDELFGLY